MSKAEDWDFWRYVEKRGHNGHWIWVGKVDGQGYGIFLGRGAHRVAYVLSKGPIPDGKVIDHKCNRKNCVRPSHLRPLSHLRNMMRAYDAGSMHSPRGRAYVESVRRERTSRAYVESVRRAIARWGDTPAAEKAARRNYSRWKNRHGAHDKAYGTLRRAIDYVHEEMKSVVPSHYIETVFRSWPRRNADIENHLRRWPGLNMTKLRRLVGKELVRPEVVAVLRLTVRHAARP